MNAVAQEPAAGGAGEHDALADVRTLVGRRGPAVPAADPVNVAMVRQWCDAIGDRNPVYLDEERASRSTHRGLIAPPAMMQVWTMPGFTRRLAEDPVTAAYDMLRRRPYPAIVAVNCEQTYARSLRPGDRIAATRWIEAVSPVKRTAIGTGVFVSSVTEVADQNGTRVGLQRYRVLIYRPEDQDVAPPSGARSPTARADPQGPGARGGDPIAGPGRVTVGAHLPTLRVPLTRTLIVAAALASHDWEPIHHDPAAARANGLDDVFMNILSTNGFVGRFVTDWAGPDATLTAIRIRLGVPSYPGDTMELRGRVRAVVDGATGVETEVDVQGSNRRGTPVSGVVAVRFPPST